MEGNTVYGAGRRVRGLPAFSATMEGWVAGTLVNSSRYSGLPGRIDFYLLLIPVVMALFSKIDEIIFLQTHSAI